MISAHSLHCQAAPGHTLESVIDDLNIHPAVWNIQNVEKTICYGSLKTCLFYFQGCV